MAQVDFSNATIEIDTTYSTRNPAGTSYINISGVITDAGENTIAVTSTSGLINESKQYMVQVLGTFTASGTEFYFQANRGYARWKVSNISFSSGDTFVFQVNASLVCN